jgi:hypothetical protein
VLVVSSSIGYLLQLILGHFPINPQVFRILRIARITRALKSLRMLRRLKSMARLIDTLVVSIPAMGNIVSLTFLIMFMFTVLGMDFFGFDSLDMVLYSMIVTLFTSINAYI